MDQIEFIYQASGLDKEALMPQISKALEKRLELRSRQAMPKMWKQTDKLNEGEKPSEEEQKRRRTIKKVQSVMFIILGIILLVPGLMGRESSTMLLVVGAIAVCYGLFSLRGARKPSREKFDNAAREFLDGQAESLDEQDIEVCFSGQEMIFVSGALEELDQDAVPFGEIEFVMETRDVFFMIFRGRGAILQKKDITLGTVDEFRQFAAKQIKPVIDLTGQET